jgi:hypothetical protein
MSVVSYSIDPSTNIVGIKTLIRGTVSLPSGFFFNNNDVLKITLPTDTTGSWDTSSTAVCASVSFSFADDI